MNKRAIAIIMEAVPVISALINLILFSTNGASPLRGRMIATTMGLAFLGFVFFFIGRKLAKGDRTVRVLGILDWLATAYVIGIYVVAIFAFGL